jgi:hypothetical protein
MILWQKRCNEISIYHASSKSSPKSTRLLQVKQQGRRSKTVPQPGYCREDPHCFQANPSPPPQLQQSPAARSPHGLPMDIFFSSFFLVSMHKAPVMVIPDWRKPKNSYGMILVFLLSFIPWKLSTVQLASTTHDHIVPRTCPVPYCIISGSTNPRIDEYLPTLHS